MNSGQPGGGGAGIRTGSVSAPHVRRPLHRRHPCPSHPARSSFCCTDHCPKSSWFSNRLLSESPGAGTLACALAQRRPGRRTHSHLSSPPPPGRHGSCGPGARCTADGTRGQTLMSLLVPGNQISAHQSQGRQPGPASIPLCLWGPQDFGATLHGGSGALTASPLLRGVRRLEAPGSCLFLCSHRPESLGGSWRPG